MVVTAAELRRNLWDVAIVLLQLVSPKCGERFTSRPAVSFYFVTFSRGRQRLDPDAEMSLLENVTIGVSPSWLRVVFRDYC